MSLDIQPISSLHDPRLVHYVNLKEKQLHLHREVDGSAPYGLFMAEGELVVRELVRSRFAVRSILLTPARLATLREHLEVAGVRSPVYVVEPELLEVMVGFNLHRGVLAIGVRERPRELGELLDTVRGLVVLEDLTNHDNVGGVFRNIACLAGPQVGVVFSPRCCDPLYRKSVRISIGHVLHIPFAVAGDWPGALRTIGAAGFETLAMTPGEGSEDLTKLPPIKKPAIVIGAEGAGLTAGAMAMASRKVRIAIRGEADSLNANVACAIALHRLFEVGA
jgi:tRNA G18 (ribose-2'-O)-methylase SpoU